MSVFIPPQPRRRKKAQNAGNRLAYSVNPTSGQKILNFNVFSGDFVYFPTDGFLIHGRRHARIFGQIFGQVFDQGFWPGFFGQKIQCTGLLGQRNTVLQFDRDRNIQFHSSIGTEKE